MVVTWGDGSPVRKAEVTIEAKSGAKQSATADEDGRARFDRPGPGSYTLRARNLSGRETFEGRLVLPSGTGNIAVRLILDAPAEPQV